MPNKIDHRVYIVSRSASGELMHGDLVDPKGAAEWCSALNETHGPGTFIPMSLADLERARNGEITGPVAMPPRAPIPISTALAAHFAKRDGLEPPAPSLPEGLRDPHRPTPISSALASRRAKGDGTIPPGSPSESRKP